MSSNFETYFSLAELAQRIPKSATFWRAELKAGAFGPLDRCLFVGGEYYVPASAVAHYLDTHKVGAGPLADLTNSRQRQPEEPRADLSPGIAARSAGELKRKLETAGHEEEANHA